MTADDNILLEKYRKKKMLLKIIYYLIYIVGWYWDGCIGYCMIEDMVREDRGRRTG